MEYTVANKKFKLVVLVVRTHDDLGRPRHAEFLYEEESVDITNELNRELVVAFVEVGVLDPDPKKVEAQA